MTFVICCILYNYVGYKWYASLMLTIDVKVTQRLKVSRLRQKYSNHIRSKNKCGSNAGWFKAWQTRGCNGKLGWNVWRTCRYSCCLSIIWKPNAFACMASLPVRLLGTIVSLIQELCRHLHLHQKHWHIKNSAKQTLLLLMGARATGWYMPVCESNPIWLFWLVSDCFLFIESFAVHN